MQPEDHPLGLFGQQAADHHLDHAGQSDMRPGPDDLTPKVGRHSDAQRDALEQRGTTGLQLS
jgi:hypothetical protein